MANQPASNISLRDVIPVTIRRGIPISDRKSAKDQQLAILNFGSEGPYALDGVLPVFVAPLIIDDQEQLASRFDFNLNSNLFLGMDGIIDGSDPPVEISWSRFFSVIPEVPEDYSDAVPEMTSDVQNGTPLEFFGNESMNIYRSLMGFEFDVNNSQNLDSSKSIVVFGTWTDGYDTETRESFVKEWDGYDVAGFTSVAMDHSSGNQWSRVFNVQSNKYDNEKSTIALDDSALPWMRLINVAFKSTVHEQGHALGLSHPGTYNGAIKGVQEYLWDQDSWDQTIMSYSQQPKTYELFGNTQGFSLLNLTPRTLDLLALDEIYKRQTDSQGRSFGTHRAFLGDTVFGFNTNITEDQSIVYANLGKLYDYRIATTIADGDGNDTIDASGFKYGNTIDLYVMTGDETSSRLSSLNGTIGNLSLAVGTVIENAIGGNQSDKIFDNQYNNRLVGKAGDDWFSASGGIDRIIGGSGYDRAVIHGNEEDFIVKNKSKSKTVIRHKNERDFRVTLKDVEKYIFGNPMDTAMNAENRGGEMVVGSKSSSRSNALLGMHDEEESLNLFGASDQLL
jgi:hypothetical protein